MPRTRWEFDSPYPHRETAKTIEIRTPYPLKDRGVDKVGDMCIKDTSLKLKKTKTGQKRFLRNVSREIPWLSQNGEKQEIKVKM